MEPLKIGKRGTLVVPAKLRKRFGFEEGAIVTIEPAEDGLLIRRAVVVPAEVYSPERKAEFLLNTAVSREDYDDARKAVLAMGLNPDAIPHSAPSSLPPKK